MKAPPADVRIPGAATHAFLRGGLRTIFPSSGKVRAFLVLGTMAVGVAAASAAMRQPAPPDAALTPDGLRDSIERVSYDTNGMMEFIDAKIGPATDVIEAKVGGAVRFVGRAMDRVHGTLRDAVEAIDRSIYPEDYDTTPIILASDPAPAPAAAAPHPAKAAAARPAADDVSARKRIPKRHDDKTRVRRHEAPRDDRGPPASTFKFGR